MAKTTQVHHSTEEYDGAYVQHSDQDFTSFIRQCLKLISSIVIEPTKELKIFHSERCSHQIYGIEYRDLPSMIPKTEYRRQNRRKAGGLKLGLRIEA